MGKNVPKYDGASPSRPCRSLEVTPNRACFLTIDPATDPPALRVDCSVQGTIHSRRPHNVSIFGSPLPLPMSRPRNCPLLYWYPPRPYPFRTSYVIVPHSSQFNFFWPSDGKEGRREGGREAAERGEGGGDVGRGERCSLPSPLSLLPLLRSHCCA